MFSLCCDVFEGFTTVSLARSRPYSKLDSNDKIIDVPNIDASMFLEECITCAWGTVQGCIVANFHNY